MLLFPTVTEDIHIYHVYAFIYFCCFLFLSYISDSHFSCKFFFVLLSFSTSFLSIFIYNTRYYFNFLRRHTRSAVTQCPTFVREIWVNWRGRYSQFNDLSLTINSYESRVYQLLNVFILL